MTRERTRSQVAPTVERPSERMGGNVVPLTASTRERRVSAARWDGLENFLAALPQVFGLPTQDGRENDRRRPTFGNDAA